MIFFNNTRADDYYAAPPLLHRYKFPPTLEQG